MSGEAEQNVQDRTVSSNAVDTGQILYLLIGATMIIVGLLGGSFGAGWSERIYEFAASIETMQVIQTYVPYFPFVPFYPVFLIMVGAGLVVRSRK